MSSKEIIDEIVEVVIERGSLSMEEIQQTWGISRDDYAPIQKEVLKHGLLTKGKQRTGGFVVRQRQDRIPMEIQSSAPEKGDTWEAMATRRLCELFQHKELEALLGDLKDVIRASRKAKTGEDRRGTKTELATGLVIQHATDLFASKDIRRHVAKKCAVSAPDKWHPGKHAAIEFVKCTGFPDELFGIPAEDRRPDFEYLEGRTRLKPLQDFQLEVKRYLLDTLARPGGRGIMTLPTGAGKTRVAVEAIRDRLSTLHGSDAKPKTVLWLAHTEELCEQSYKCFKEVWDDQNDSCPLLILRFWGQYTKNFSTNADERKWLLDNPSALISTPQRIANLLISQDPQESEVSKDILAATEIVVIDEAHRAAAKTYQLIIDRFSNSDKDSSIVGLTATPFRSEYLGNDSEKGTQELQQLFSELIEPIQTLGRNPRVKLIERQILANPEFQTIKTSTAIRLSNPHTGSLSIESEERVDRAMQIRADNSPRRLAVLQRILKITKVKGSAILYFGPSVNDAECMAFLLRQEGVPAAALSGNTRDVTRRKLIREFRDARIQVLCNCEVLTTGFDAPIVTHLVVARPTVSRVLYEQIIGRGLRGKEFGGTESCVILDCEDNFKGDRPPLGYETFRDLWNREVKEKQ